ncbi:DUF1571 domain-containing protein [Telmatocola sphagniphila]|uniref:DUF1571 domain-containing protein n=1 Tax=Telmatocola sphagniphila TaxID=1123043 RepID=A0A8E6ETJ2_9BACT|nr:DUF1571 domain-containing protein [Telmatocola sphagniphila]QVL32494.1 DUF1571 domain-containing protein [Telmatocola sphagniphila]
MKRLLLLLPICLCFAPRNESEALGLPSANGIVALTPDMAGRPSPEQFERLVQTDIVRALAAGLARYRAEVQDYTCVMTKQERLGGKVRPVEIIRCAYREKPYSVLMKWEAGDSKAISSLFVQGENNDELIVLPKLLGFIKKTVSRSPSHPDVKDASRYSVFEFGIAKGQERTYAAWKAAQQAGLLNVEFLGERPIPELENRPCYVIHRMVNPPEEDGMTDLTIYIDKETWLQTGSILTANGNLIGSYFFNDVKTNQKLGKDDFKPEVLKK